MHSTFTRSSKPQACEKKKKKVPQNHFSVVWLDPGLLSAEVVNALVSLREGSWFESGWSRSSPPSCWHGHFFKYLLLERWSSWKLSTSIFSLSQQIWENTDAGSMFPRCLSDVTDLHLPVQLCSARNFDEQWTERSWNWLDATWSALGRGPASLARKQGLLTSLKNDVRESTCGGACKETRYCSSAMDTGD